MNRIILIDSFKCGKAALTFENGERLSIVWDACTYSDNQNDIKGIVEDKPWSSTTVEIFGADGKQINEYLEEKYGQAPAPRVPVNDIPKIINDIQNFNIDRSNKL